MARYYLGFRRSDTLVPHVQLQVHLYYFIHCILKTQNDDYISCLQQMCGGKKLISHVY